MKASDIREMAPDEMRQKLADTKQELFNLRFQHEVGQLENPKKIGQTKRDIARLKSIIRELELNQTSDNT